MKKTRQCVLCQGQFEITQKIDGVRRILKNRTKCLTCSPFGSTLGHAKLPLSQRLEKNQEKQKRYYDRYKMSRGIDPVTLRRSDRRQQIITELGGKCQICSYNKLTKALAFHHLRDKKFGLTATNFNRSFGEISSEITKTVLVCHNCHAEIHEGIHDFIVIQQLNSDLQERLKTATGW